MTLAGKGLIGLAVIAGATLAILSAPPLAGVPVLAALALGWWLLR